MNQQFPPPPPQYNPYQQAPGGYMPYNQNPYGFGMQTDAPGAGTAQVCGIIGIVLFFSIFGIIFNIIAIVFGSRAMREHQLYPGRYTDASFRKAKAGKTCGIVGLCLFPAAIIIIFAIVAAVEGF